MNGKPNTIDVGLHPANSARMDEVTRSMILDPATWPMGILMMKRRSHPMTFGHLTEGGSDVIRRGGELVILVHDIAETIQPRGFAVYATIDDALKDGWTVD